MCSRPTRRGGRPSPGCARSVVVDTLTALAIHLELGADWAQVRETHPGRVLARADPVPLAVRRSRPPRGDHEDRIDSSPAGCWSSPPGITAANPGSARPSRTARKGSPITSCRSQTAPAAPASPLHLDEGARQASQRHDRRGRPRAVVLPLGRRHRTLTSSLHRTDSSTPAQEAGTPGRHSGRHARIGYEQPHPGATLVPRPAHRRQQKQGHGVSESPHFRLATPSPSPTSRPPETPATPPSATQLTAKLQPAPLTNASAISVLARSMPVPRSDPARVGPQIALSSSGS